MAIVFDTLAFSHALEDAGIPREHADAHANAARDYIMRELVTKSEMNDALNRQTIRLGSIVVVAVAALGVFLTLAT
ncbi:MAG TPA: hypothetical protein ENH55_12235 [Aurantimonas coralicida]|uniref:DUF1640 domain-containing protein n=2 Tax=root TaxID=1 RepID=A0A9C9TJ92_9HYPH|nr:hypothetical protein [Aurantimonas coralicida]HEU02598.1 hypothetical protein [Aurantimonas coralicida]